MTLYKIALATPEISVGNIQKNTEVHKDLIQTAINDGNDFILFPELSLSGVSCADLFYHSSLHKAVLIALEELKDFSSKHKITIILGAPLQYNNELYNCALVLKEGSFIAAIPSKNPNRWFSTNINNTEIDLCSQVVPFGNTIICDGALQYSCQIPSSNFSNLVDFRGNCLFVLGSCEASFGNSKTLKQTLKSISYNNKIGLFYTSSGACESTTDFVYDSNHLSYNSGIIQIERNYLSLSNKYTQTEFHLELSLNLKIKNQTINNHQSNCQIINLQHPTTPKSLNSNIKLTHSPSPYPFIPSDPVIRNEKSSHVFQTQAVALAKRLKHIGSTKVILGISGGLDSTLALLVCNESFKILELPPDNIIGITMPGFGTTDRTYENACNLIKELGNTLKEISIKESCLQHFKDISHDPSTKDITYENSQARERTQILMDIANSQNALVVGTGDLSELALGWATFGGDHLSMYGVNAGLSKTLVQTVVKYIAENSNKTIQSLLLDILSTPISPELIPATDNGEIAQKTEDIVGPYPLHDFFLYYTLKYSFTPADIFIYAKHAFKNEYSDETLLHWLNTFFKRFFSQQFKRSCMPDGPKVDEISLSPRGALLLPSDIDSQLWLQEIENLRRNR